MLHHFAKYNCHHDKSGIGYSITKCSKTKIKQDYEVLYAT